MDKAPDAFRTISEVADDLDIPQHVLRFWETRFSQIKPMKRSGGRRYYRPDDVELLRGIRRLLYAEGYTIRGVQRILKEQGVKAVQGLGAGAPLSRAAAPPSERAPPPPEPELALEPEAEEAAQPRPAVRAPKRTPEPEPAAADASSTAEPPQPATTPLGDARRATLQAALDDLLACRAMLDKALAE